MPRQKTRKGKRKQKGGGKAKAPLDPVIVEKWDKKTNTILGNLQMIQESVDFPVADVNDGDYSYFKKTRIPVGTKFFFRSKMPRDDFEERPVWLNYSASVNKQSFLVPPLNPEELPPELVSLIIKKFGDWLIEVEVIEPLTILHFPVDYSSPEASEAGHSYSAVYERLIRKFCAKIPPSGYDFSKACADGYSLDFFYKQMLGRFSSHKWNPGFRELCVYKPWKHLQIVASHYKPLGEA